MSDAFPPDDRGRQENAGMPPYKCPLCKNPMLHDCWNQEWCCGTCGFARRSEMEEEHCGARVHRQARKELLGSRPRDPVMPTDFLNRPLGPDVRRSLRTGAGCDRRRPEHVQAAFLRVATLYDRFVLDGYDDGIKKADVEALRGHVANVIRAVGPRQTDLDLMRIIRNYLRIKLGRSPGMKKFFNLGGLQMRIRHGRERPENVTGRGNQVGRGRMEYRIDRCNLCRVPIENYGTRDHHIKFHPGIPYHRYISRRNNNVGRAATVSGASVGCARGFNPARPAEVGPCTRCGVPDATIRRYLVRISRRNSVTTVSRMVARHRDSATGRWKACILGQRRRAGR